jgi:hypothetical protein
MNCSPELGIRPPDTLTKETKLKLRVKEFVPPIVLRLAGSIRSLHAGTNKGREQDPEVSGRGKRNMALNCNRLIPLLVMFIFTSKRRLVEGIAGLIPPRRNS